MKGKLFIISGPSGSGKTTLANHALNSFDNLKFSVSYTTRKKRQNENNGVHYVFISKMDFEKMKEDGLFAEWAEVHGNYYGTLIKSINDSVDNGTDILLDIDVQGANQLKGKFSEAVFIFVIPPSIKLLENRLKKRNSDKKEDITLRMNVVKLEIKQSKEYDYIIINDDINFAKKKIESVIIAERNGVGISDDRLIRKSLVLSDSIRSEKVYKKEVLDNLD